MNKYMKITKQTKEQEKVAMETMAKIVNSLADVLRKNEEDFIEEMVASMKVQADIISRGRKNGVEIEKVMDKVKIKYMTPNPSPLIEV